jgi:NAD(P)-dependent dehydrogenase (short-subunit alcohol dehydrogenase family)
MELTIIQATKAAIESFVRTWNNEFGAEQGITVNAVNPGPVKCVFSCDILVDMNVSDMSCLLHSTDAWNAGKSTLWMFSWYCQYLLILLHYS